jgi:methyl-accepting chemotaxis protein
LRDLVQHVEQIDGLVSEIAASAQEQSVALHEVNTTINQMDQVTQQNAAMVEQSTAATHGLRTETAELERLIGEFRIAATTGRPAVAPAVPTLRPAPSQPRQMVERLRQSFGGAAPKLAATPRAEEAWDEF